MKETRRLLIVDQNRCKIKMPKNIHDLRASKTGIEINIIDLIYFFESFSYECSFDDAKY